MVKDVIDFLIQQDPQVGNAVKAEYDRQRRNIELIASENFVSEAVLAAASSVLTNKYAEGYPGKRYYGGCECVDVVENIARDRAKALFGADHVNVQPHSGASANYAVYQALCNVGDTVLGMNLATVSTRSRRTRPLYTSRLSRHFSVRSIVRTPLCVYYFCHHTLVGPEKQALGYSERRIRLHLAKNE